MARSSDNCTCCGSESLFSGYFDAEDLAFPLDMDTPAEQVPAGVRWTTFCNDCGTEQDKPRRRKS
jgi:hypothetical protein